MIFNRNKLIERFPWLIEKDLPMIVSADYDGLICASFLNHYLNWTLEGYYDLNNIWISKSGMMKKKELIWVDLNILPKQGRAIGGHIVTIADDTPKGFKTSCNPNIIAKVTSQDFKSKFPFSTLFYLLWIHNIEFYGDFLSLLLILHTDSTWLKFQHYENNCKEWQQKLSNYDWNVYFDKIFTKQFEKDIDQTLYPILKEICAFSDKSKLKSKFLKIQSQQYQFNPDWDEDVVLNLFKLYGKSLGWTPPPIPDLEYCIEGIRKKVPLSLVKEKGLSRFIQKNQIFSYAIPSPKIFNFTSFGLLNKSPLEKNG